MTMFTPKAFPRVLLLVPALALLIVSPPPLVAQSSTPEETAPADTSGQRQAPVFSEEVRVRLVTLPVLARDRRGRPVTDLRSDEIEVVDGDSTHSVAFLSPFFEEADDRRGLPAVRLVTQIPGGSREVARSTIREPRHLLILADLINDPPMGRKQAVGELSSFLADDLDPSFQVALMVYDGDLELALPFTHDRSTVAPALSKAYENSGGARSITPQRRMEQLIRKLEMCEIDEPDDSFDQEDPDRISAFAAIPDIQCLRDSMNEYSGEVIPRSTAFLSALEGVIGYAAGLDGHTFVLTIGGNVAMNPSREVAEAMRAIFGPMDEIAQLEQTLYSEELVRPHMDRLMHLAYQNNVSLSFLDRSRAPSDFSARYGQSLQPGFRPQLTAFHTAQQDLDEVATSTGGAFVASTQVREGLRKSLELMEGGYYVSYYVNDDASMSQERVDRIRLSSTRSGVTLKHRRAFEGVRREAQAEPRRVRGIIQVGFPEMQEFDGKPGYFVPLRLIIEPRDLGYQEGWDEAAAEFTVHLKISTPRGALLTDSYHVLKHSYPRDIWNSGDLEPPQVLAWADLKDGDYFAEAVVTVPGDGSRGTIRRHIAVRGSEAAAELQDATTEE